MSNNFEFGTVISWPWPDQNVFIAKSASRSSFCVSRSVNVLFQTFRLPKPRPHLSNRVWEGWRCFRRPRFPTGFESFCGVSHFLSHLNFGRFCRGFPGM